LDSKNNTGVEVIERKKGNKGSEKEKGAKKGKKRGEIRTRRNTCVSCQNSRLLLSKLKKKVPKFSNIALLLPTFVKSLINQVLD
jgi:hypothetical protein